MPTLNYYRKLAGYKSIKAFAEAAQAAGVALRWTSYGPFTGRQEYVNVFTPSIAQQWLHGYIREDLKPDDEAKLLVLLNITTEQLPDVREESQDAHMAKWRVKHPPMTEEQWAQYDADQKAWCEARVAKMTNAEKRRLHEDAVRLGVALPERRSPLDILIDQACGLE